MVSISASALHHTLEYGDFDIYILKDDNQKEHVVLIRGDIENDSEVLCRISSECLPGTALFSAECDCKEQIQFSLNCISKKGQGIFIYLRQEGRGHGLTTKIRALANKNLGYDTFEAVEKLGLPSDAREYSIVKEILEYFKVKSINCICNNPDKINAIRNEGIDITSITNIPVTSNKFSHRHLEAKKVKGHKIDFIEELK